MYAAVCTLEKSVSAVLRTVRSLDGRASADLGSELVELDGGDALQTKSELQK